MSRPSPALLGLTAIAGVSLLLAGCSAPGGGGGGDLDYEDSPLYKYNSALYGGGDEDAYIAQANEVEELTATCMEREGFEYIPVDQSQYYSFGSGDEIDYNSEEWVAANGYGYNQTEEQIEEQNGRAGEYVDPNQDYVMSLSEGEQTAYYEVLYGPQPTDEEINDENFVWQQLGCQGESNKAVRGTSAYEDPKYKSLVDAMNELWTQLEKDPEMAQLNTQWSSCMADAGYTLSSKNDVYDILNDQQNDAWANGEEGPSAEKRAEMREFEIDMALADFHCAEGLDFTNKSLTIQFALEQRFIDEHKAELDAMLAEYAQAK